MIEMEVCGSRSRGFHAMRVYFLHLVVKTFRAKTGEGERMRIFVAWRKLACLLRRP